MKKLGLLFGLTILLLTFASAQTSTVCCEQTTSGALCQNVPASECAPGAQQVPTACSSTSFCQPGVCFDSTEGICMSNTPQLVCNDNGGIWSATDVPQCELGCCILGNQAAFVSLVRCKKLSAQLGIETNYNSNIDSELSCLEVVQAQDRGACVYDFEFETNCKFTTRADCDTLQVPGAEGGVVTSFTKDVLCSAEELGTVCGPSSKTTCVDGRDEVYFVDTCGNPANVYDASRRDDQSYWTNVIQPSNACGANSGNGNAGSANCGNCDYLKGSICRGEDVAGATPTYGDFVCADLNCGVTSDGSSRLHGESWCVYNDAGGQSEGQNTVGSRFYRHICANGEEIVEQCGDMREEVCLEGEINGFSQAACRVNRWQDCTQQYEQDDCENTDQRDCYWLEGELLNLPEDLEPEFGRTGSCIPTVPPGLNFWSGEETSAVCSLGDAQCVVQFEAGLLDGEKECVENCHCLEQQWEDERAAICASLGDCGPGQNFVGVEGTDGGFKKIIERL